MCLLFCLRQTHWGAGPGPVAIDREVVYSDMTDWRRFGRVPDFSDGRLRRDRSTTGSPRMWMGSCMGLSGFDFGHCHATGSSRETGIGGIGRDIVSGGVSQLRLC